MALTLTFLSLPLETTTTDSIFNNLTTTSQLSSFSSNKLKHTNHFNFNNTLSFFPKSLRTPLLQVKSQTQESDTLVFKQLLLPVVDRNPYLTEGTKNAMATTAALANKYGAEITVVVIDEKEKDTLTEHQTQIASIRWHLSEGGFQEFKLLERLGEGNKPTAIIGEVADEMNMDLVIMSMEAIHSKHVDANLLAEFVPCPLLLLPL